MVSLTESLAQLNQQDLAALLSGLGPSDQNAILDLFRDRTAVPATEFRDRYDLKLERDRNRQKQMSLAGQEIGISPESPIPMMTDIGRERRHESRYSLRRHCELYHGHVFTCAWAEYHYRLIEVIEMCIFRGGWFAMAVPRGGGKSTLAECAAEWAILHGHKCWPVLIGATIQKAVKRLKNLKAELRINRLLLSDFPEVCHPLVRLEGSARKAEGQRLGGFRTAIEWGSEQITLPTIDDEILAKWHFENFELKGYERPVDVSGSRVTALGLTGDIRGLSEKTEKLKSIRPDLAIPDDPQTRDSAKSFTQSKNRADTITGDVAYLNGPTTKMSIVMPATVICRGDMVDQILDKDLNPEWRGERHKMVSVFPVNETLWDRYGEIRRESKRLGLDETRCNEFYTENREEMDAGAVVTWPERYDTDTELSAIQHAMNLKIRDNAAFMAEAQNDPEAEAESEAVVCPASQIILKQHHCERFVVPNHCTDIAVGIDIQQRMFFYTVMAASKDFECAIIDYGTCPEQGRTFFSYKEEGLRTIQDVWRDMNVVVDDSDDENHLQTMLRLALMATIRDFGGRKYVREDGVELSPGKILVDCGWQLELVLRACAETEYSGISMAAKGIFVGAKNDPLAMRKYKRREKLGHEHVIKPNPSFPSQLYTQHNTNAWKTQLHSGFIANGGKGSVSLWKDRPERHRMLAEHCNGELPTRVTAKGNVVDEWTERPTKPDNHLMDTTCLALVGLSTLGCAIPNVHAQPKRAKYRRTLKTNRIGSN